MSLLGKIFGDSRSGGIDDPTLLSGKGNVWAAIQKERKQAKELIDNYSKLVANQKEMLDLKNKAYIELYNKQPLICVEFVCGNRETGLVFMDVICERMSYEIGDKVTCEFPQGVINEFEIETFDKYDWHLGTEKFSPTQPFHTISFYVIPTNLEEYTKNIQSSIKQQ